jgi:hypothetical protein
MTYQHFEPPVAKVTIDADAYPKALALQILIDAWNYNYTGVMHLISALSVYRETVYNVPLNAMNATVENAMHFAQSHPVDDLTSVARTHDLAIKFLDYIKFFEGLEECVGISDDNAPVEG